MNIKTKFEEIPSDSRDWFLVDATGLPVGRLASEIAKIIRGKHKPSFAPHIDVGDHVVVVNASKVEMTANKPEAKVYYSHSGYPGGLKEETFNSLRQRKPEQIIQKAVWGMLPKNRLGRSTIKKLHVYSDEKHLHGAQNPQELKLEIEKVE
ncbi:MAG: 50S ribosomal protein L13 [Actinomycetota bacterium]|nr:50S ribosomal protein L13 [Actinomycetota bacterium]|tara:strand:+ start:233 stop:685 length:453 start_codon:yes stop_codon:yes gene_type:complete